MTVNHNTLQPISCRRPPPPPPPIFSPLLPPDFAAPAGFIYIFFCDFFLGRPHKDLAALLYDDASLSLPGTIFITFRGARLNSFVVCSSAFAPPPGPRSAQICPPISPSVCHLRKRIIRLASKGSQQQRLHKLNQSL